MPAPGGGGRGESKPLAQRLKTESATARFPPTPPAPRGGGWEPLGHPVQGVCPPTPAPLGQFLVPRRALWGSDPLFSALKRKIRLFRGAGGGE